MNTNTSKTRQLTILAMLTAMAYVVGMFIRIRFMPGAPFLTYDPKDVVIVLGGLMFGPLPALTMSVVLAFLEMITHSTSGPIGMLMNAIASASFACPAAYIYQKKRTLSGAVLGIIAGVIIATGTMLLWNYIMVPIFNTAITRERAASMLLPIFLPFNLIKTSLNGAIVLLIYKPITTALKASRWYNPASIVVKGRLNIGLLLAAGFVAVSLIVLIIVMRPAPRPESDGGYAAARQFVTQNTYRIIDEFMHMSRSHDVSDASAVTIDYGLRMTHVRDDIMEVRATVQHLRDILLPTYDWLFVISYNGNSRGYVIVQYIGDEHTIQWQGELDVDGDVHTGYMMCAYSFWHFDTVVERYAGSFDPQNLFVYCFVDDGFWIINSQFDAIELAPEVTVRALRNDIPLVMDGCTIARIISLDIQSVGDVWCLPCRQAGASYDIFMGFYEFYLSLSMPHLLSPASQLELLSEGIVEMEVIALEEMVVTYVVTNSSERYVLFGYLFGIEFFNGDEWMTIWYRRPARFSFGGDILRRSEYKEYSVNLALLYPLEAGLYRIRKQYNWGFWRTMMPHLYDVVAEFVIE